MLCIVHVGMEVFWLPQRHALFDFSSPAALPSTHLLSFDATSSSGFTFESPYLILQTEKNPKKNYNTGGGGRNDWSLYQTCFYCTGFVDHFVCLALQCLSVLRLCFVFMFCVGFPRIEIFFCWCPKPTVIWTECTGCLLTDFWGFFVHGRSLVLHASMLPCLDYHRAIGMWKVFPVKPSRHLMSSGNASTFTHNTRFIFSLFTRKWNNWR